MVASPLFVDFNQDGIAEIWVACLDGTIFHIDHKGTKLSEIAHRPKPRPKFLETLRPPTHGILSALTYAPGVSSFDPGIIGVEDDGVLVWVSSARRFGESHPNSPRHPAGWSTSAMVTPHQSIVWNTRNNISELRNEAINYLPNPRHTS